MKVTHTDGVVAQWPDQGAQRERAFQRLLLPRPLDGLAHLPKLQIKPCQSRQQFRPHDHIVRRIDDARVMLRVGQCRQPRLLRFLR